MALFGCSPLLLTSIADHFFTTQTAAGETILNVTRFLTCLSLVTGLSHILGAVTLPGRSSTASSTTSPTREDNPPSELAIQERPSIHQPSPSTSGETTPLLGRRSLSPSSMSSKNSVAVEVDVVEAREVTPPQHGSTLDLICDPWFPTLLAVVAILVGCVSPLQHIRYTVSDMQSSVRDGHRKPFAYIPFSPQFWRSVFHAIHAGCLYVDRGFFHIDTDSATLRDQHAREAYHRTPCRLHGPGTCLLFPGVWNCSSRKCASGRSSE